MEVREDFSAYLDGELATDEREALEAHLAGCADCLRELDTMKRVEDAYRGLPPVNAPAGFEAGVRDVVRSGRLASEPARRPVPRWMGPLVAMATAAAVLLVGVIVFEVRQESQPGMQMAGAPPLESADNDVFFNTAPATSAPQVVSTPDQGPAGGGAAWQDFARASESAPVQEQETEQSGAKAKAKTDGAWESFARAPAPATDTGIVAGREDNASALADSLAAAGVSAEADAASVDEEMRERAEVIGAPPAGVAADAPARAEALQTPAFPEVRAGVGEVVSRRVLRSFKVRADGAWVESGYAGEPTTELKRGSAVLNQVMQQHVSEEWDKILRRTALQIFQLGGTWYTLEGKPAEE